MNTSARGSLQATEFDTPKAMSRIGATTFTASQMLGALSLSILGPGKYSRYTTRSSSVTSFMHVTTSTVPSHVGLTTSAALLTHAIPDPGKLSFYMARSSSLML